MPDSREVTLNFGPQHPATHGVLRLVLVLDGEYVKDTKLYYGYLHRGMEKLAESRTYDQIIPMVDRLDYLAAMSNGLGYVLAVEKMMDLEIPPRAQYLRILATEMSRIASHLLWLAAFAIDLGAITPIMYCFREREILMDIFEEVSGARLTYNYMRIGGVKADFSEKALTSIREFVKIFPGKMKDYETLLNTNPVFVARTKNVGIISARDAVNFGLSGPCLRGSGVKFDLRKNEPYAGYENFSFDVPTGAIGDVYDRYLVRMEEMRQSNRILEQALDKLPAGEILTSDPRVYRPPKDHALDNVESLIQYCYIAMEGIRVPAGECYTRIEAPKGELGFYIVSDGSAKPYRMYIRPPSFINLDIVPKLAEGRLVADLVSILGSIDIVLGEVDK
ncbi:MAG: NADH-quinone oxidoreductase subunit D [Candidatus Schekmanbacteria bacterium]|nr:NADH-quinone oxidoreductase subunit D [Candidatus Schekmanbacteria bacterium]